jgi:hypothetical protein
MTPTTPELVTDSVDVLGEPDPPPQPILKAVAAKNTRLRQTADQMPREVDFLRRKNSGSRRNGIKIPAAAVLVTVSAKTAVTMELP